MQAVKTTQDRLAIDRDLTLSLEASEVLEARTSRKRQVQELIHIKRDRDAAALEFGRLFFFVGLSVSLVLAIVLINWKTYEVKDVVDLGDHAVTFEEVIEVPTSRQPPPPAPKMNQVVKLVEVDDAVIVDEIKIKLDVEMTEETLIQDHQIDFTIAPVEEEVVEELFTVVETWPQPKGGMNAFYAYLGANIVYPQTAKRLQVSGIVFLQFVVETNGEITDIQVIRGIGAGCDEEAVRVLQEAPDWIPGKQRGRPVRVLMTVPVRFVLKESL